MKLEEKITLLRKKQGWSQEELAFRLDVSRQAVSKWEIGDSMPDLDKIIKMSEIFSVTTDYLLKDNEGEIRAVENTVLPTGVKERKNREEPKEVSEDEDWEEKVFVDEQKSGVRITWEWDRDLFSTAFGCVMLVIYLAVSFWTGRWGVTWIIWLLYGPLETIGKLIFRKGKKQKILEMMQNSKRAVGIFEDIYWPLVVALYFSVSFWTGRWDITWIIWVVAVACSAMITSIIRSRIAIKEAKEKYEQQKEKA